MSNSDFISPAQHEQKEVLFDSGGTCDCYRLVKDNRVYCVKRPKKDMRSSEVYMNLFRKEFELGIELEHPNIVRYFAYDEDEQGPFIRMDYIDGDSLDAFVAQHPDYFKDKGHRKQFCDELFSALSYLHDKKMLHLDLKPSNILITNKGHHVKLIDLGFGWSESYLHDLGFTREYCAPEQQAAKTELFGPATDIYALGKILQRFGLAKDAVIQGCLKENSKERYQSVGALQKAFRRNETKSKATKVLYGVLGVVVIG
nr:serine/threonine protein kinase [Bacteroidales bacterium]